MPATSLPCPLRLAAEEDGGATAIEAPGRRIDYATFDRHVGHAARRLGELGLGPGAHLGLRLPNGWRALVLIWAALRARVVVCPLSTRAPLSAASGQLDRIGCRRLVTDEHVPAGGSFAAIAPEELVPDAVPGGTRNEATVDLEAPATVVFTSGSTGRPKAALHALGNHYYSALGSNRNIALGPGDGWLLSLPLYHVGGLAVLFRCVLGRAAVVLPADGEPVAEAVRRTGATHVSLVATQLLRWMREDDDASLDRLRAVLLGGSAIPPSLLDAACARGLPVHTTYGLTEMASQVTTTPPAASRAALASSGRLLDFRELRMADDGEICVRGPTRFLGYLDAGGREEPFDADGWFHTGDLGRLDADGLLHVEGRKDNLFISGGENIQPEEIEAALCRLDEVAEAVVVPVDDAEFGHRPVAFVRTRGDVAPERLVAHLEDLLPRFKIPVAFHPWPAGAPAGMKVDRARFRRLAAR